MIEAYGFATPNSIRVPIALEELGIEYVLRPVNVRRGEQKEAAFRALNPNGKVPVLVDSAGPNGHPFVLTESAAILIYLAEKTRRLLPAVGEERARVFEQVFFQVTGIGPANWPNAQRWYDAIAARPAVGRAIERVAALVPQS